MIEILLATYNSEKYLTDQLDSLFEQTFEDWHLTVQDDGSTDKTVDILRKYAAVYPEKMTVHVNEKNLGGAKYNFYDMLLKADADYVMTCDHDDVWLPDKMERTMATMKDLEAQNAPDIPLLVHTDLTVVDENQTIVAASMFFQQQLDAGRTSLRELLVQNMVTGCTVMVNRALLSLLPRNIPANMVMHDWWMALVAAAFGAIGFVKDPTILYRQHGNNEVGAKNTRKLGYNAKRAARFMEARQAVADTYLQAADFAALYGDQLRPADFELVRVYADMGEYGKLKRIRTLRKRGLWKNTPARRMGQILFC